MAEAMNEPPRPNDGPNQTKVPSYKDALMGATTGALPDADATETKVQIDPKTPKTDEGQSYSPTGLRSYSKQPPLTPGRARIPRIPSPATEVKRMTQSMAVKREHSRLKNPHHAVRMTTVTMSNR